MFMIYKVDTVTGLPFVSFEGTTGALVLREVEDHIKSSESFKNSESGDLYFAIERSSDVRLDISRQKSGDSIAAQWIVRATVELVRTNFDEKYLAKSPVGDRFADRPETDRFGVD